MIASWMVYTVVVGMLVSLAALAAERALLLVKKPVRGIWAAALVLSILIPAVSPRLPWHFTLPSVPALSSIQSVTPSAASTTLPRAAGAGVYARRWSMDGTLLVAWGSCAVILALYLMYAIGVLQGRRREWRRVSLDGVPVLLSRDIGPAVIGWRRLDIVVPEWVRDLEQSARGLILRHEMEHVLRQDPRLLMRTWLGLVAMPWNPALWWQLRRLRRAIELDCDARVVASGADVSRYGSVLLEAVGRCNRGGLPAFAAFAERAADLEARIKVLTAARSKFWRGRALAAAATAMVLATAACLMPDSLAPGLARQPNLPANAPTATIEWVREILKGHPPAEAVVLYRSFDGKLLGSRTRMRSAPGAQAEWTESRVPGDLIDIPHKDIHSIQVLNGPKYAPPGIDGVVVITVNPGVAAQRPMSGSRDIGLERLRKVELAMVVAGSPPEFNASQTYVWFETNPAGAIRGAGYGSDMGSLRRRNGKRPAESGVWHTYAPQRGKFAEIHWSRYDVP